MIHWGSSIKGCRTRAISGVDSCTFVENMEKRIWWIDRSARSVTEEAIRKEHTLKHRIFNSTDEHYIEKMRTNR